MRPPLPAKILRALDILTGVLLLSKKETTREGVHEEMEVGGLVPLAKMATKLTPLLEQNKGRRRLGLGRWKAQQGARAAADPTPKPVSKGPKKKPCR